MSEEDNNTQLGAGGTEGGLGTFVAGFLMTAVGFYMLLSLITVTTTWTNTFSVGLYSMGTVYLTSGMILIPIAIGIVMVFINGKSILGWLLTGGGILALVAGVISNIHFVLRNIPLFDLLCILTLAFGGLGLIVKSVHPKKQ